MFKWQCTRVLVINHVCLSIGTFASLRHVVNYVCVRVPYIYLVGNLASYVHVDITSVVITTVTYVHTPGTHVSTVQLDLNFTHASA